ncbi:MAG: hypothetical protein ACPG77_01260 [Nannocystaceae bacterium]
MTTHSMHMHKILALVLCASVVGACDSGEKKPEPAKTATVDKPAEKPAKTPEVDEEPAVDPKVTKAVAVAKEIEANLENADAVLAKHGLDRDSLEQMMYDIARDPAMANAYEEALVGEG